MRITRLLCLAATLLVGCKLDPLGKDHCRGDEDCLTGQRCQANRCVSPDAAAPDDAAPIPDAGPPDVPAADTSSLPADAAVPDAPAPDAAPPPPDLPSDLPKPGTPCQAGYPCPYPWTCLGSICQSAPIGWSCMEDRQCTSGRCTEGVCCESASCGVCRSCRVKGFVGFCQPVPGKPDAGC
jgi:hypothetical protein